MTYGKGHIPWNKGKKLSIEHKLILSKLLKGKKKSNETIEKMRLAKIGVIPSNETKEKISQTLKKTLSDPLIRKRMSDANTGRTPWNKGLIGFGKGRKHTEESKKLMSLKATGRIISESQKEKLRIANLGRKQTKETIEKRALKLRGKPRPLKVREKIRLANMGKIVSIETKLTLSALNTGKRLGFKHSAESIMKMSQKKKGIPRPDMIGKKYTLGYHHTDQSKRKISAASKITRSRQIFPFKDSKIEVKVQELLTLLNIKYKKHFVTYHPDMGYHQVDIMICDHEGNPKMAIECDGCYWHGCPIHYPNSQTVRYGRDRIIDASLTKLGIKVIRFWEHDIAKDMIPLELFK